MGGGGTFIVSSWGIYKVITNDVTDYINLFVRK
jgi:hypothetical protein